MKEKFYLGISLGFNSSACVVSDQKGLIAAISQERLSGVKNTKEIPFDAMMECIKIARTCEIEKIIISHYEKITTEYFEKYSTKIMFGKTWQEFIINYIEAKGIKINDTKIERVKHHFAHGASTFAFYGFPNNNYYIITSDGFGDGLSGTIYEGGVGCLSEVKLKDSIALVYQFVTGALGFKMHQHEGKITGLAAYGKPIYLEDIESIYDPESTSLNFISSDIALTDEEIEQVKNSNIIDFDDFLKLKKTVFGLVEKLLEKGATREDIAASVQEFAEKHTIQWIKKYCTSEGADAYLAGGLFANVKINQRIKDLGIFKNVYVCPAMGDEGTCVGAVIHYFLMHGICLPKVTNKSDKVISGTSVDGDEDTYDYVCNEINRRRLQDIYRVRFERNPSNIIDYIARALNDKKIVCLMRDKMEFGPRALCHRSILYDATEKETNDSLNKRLSRSEFMPFAPVCCEEFADKLFLNLDGGRDSAKFMTMTFDGTEEFVEDYKAVAHVDGTARPQIISYNDDPFMWRVLNQYYNYSGLKCIVNTSFNLHEHPIVENDGVGLDSFIKADLDVLVIGNVIVEKIAG